MSRKKLKNGERLVKVFRLHKSLVTTLPGEFIEGENTTLKQILKDEKTLILQKVLGDG